MSEATNGAARTAGVPLAKLGEGHTGAVSAIQGGRNMVLRLAELGIRTGARLTVVRGKGPMIVSIKGHRLMIGHGMVNRIFVTPDAHARAQRH
jgi:Fe2+ transport system protein FeoA